MKIKPNHIIFLAVILILSCDENFVIVNCSDCLESEPVKANITLNVENNGDYNATVMIYEGNIGDSVLMEKAAISSETMEFTLVINKKYTFRVDYSGRDGVKYSAINSVYPRVKLELEQCSDMPCYYIYDKKLNMKLKYH
jgi:hypothetical protein